MWFRINNDISLVEFLTFYGHTAEFPNCEEKFLKFFFEIADTFIINYFELLVSKPSFLEFLVNFDSLL